MQEALDFAERLEVQVKLDPVTNAERALSHVAVGARQRYLQWCCPAAGRCVEDGPPGFAADQPETNQVDGLDDAALARFLFVKGGYGQAVQVDAEGWSARMHAMQASCFIGMMSDEGLRAKATSGLKKGYSTEPARSPCALAHCQQMWFSIAATTRAWLHG